LGRRTADEYVDWNRLSNLNIQRLKKVMDAKNIDAVVVSAMDNFRWLTAIPITLGWFYRFSHAAVQSRDADEPIIIAPEGYDYAEKNWFRDVRTIPFYKELQQPIDSVNWHKTCAKALEELGCKSGRIAVDPETPYVMKDGLSSELPRAEIISANKTLMEARLVKNEEEIKAIRVACNIGELGMKAGLDMVAEGTREKDIAATMVKTFIENDADVEYLPFVLSGVRPMLVHASEKAIRRDELVRIDLGCIYGGYRADFSRTRYVGRPSKDIVDTYRALIQAYMEGVEALRPGVTNLEIVQIITSKFSELTKAKQEIGSFVGHGMGIGVHEEPLFCRGSIYDEVKLEKGMYFCLEPAVMTNAGNMAVEDDFLITEDRYEMITRTDRDWPID
jgi:Xaa-Pro aminopeptidase